MTESEIKIVIAFLFKRSGKEEMSKSELYLPLSMNLNWFNPNDAKELINSAIKQDLLIEKEGFLKPSFNYKEITVPIGFRPSDAILKEDKIEKKMQEKEKTDILKTIVKRIVKKSNSNENDIIEKIKNISDEKNITNEVAALMLSIEYDVDVKDCFDEIKKIISRENIA